MELPAPVVHSALFPSIRASTVMDVFHFLKIHYALSHSPPPHRHTPYTYFKEGNDVLQ